MSDQSAWDRISSYLPFGGVAAAGAGLAALAGWRFDILALAGLGSGLIPMAPSTALLFLLYGGIVFIRSFRPGNRGLLRAGMLVHALGALVALALMLLSFHGIYLEMERLGFSTFGRIEGQPVGHMSPVTAFCFILASLSFLFSASAASRLRLAAAARLLAWLLLSISCILILAYLYGAPLLYGGSLIPPAATISGAFLFLSLALLSPAASCSSRMSTSPGTGQVSSWRMVVVFALLSTGIITAGFLFQRSFENRYRREVETQITAIANLKVKELVRYRKELLADSAVTFNNPVFIGLARRFLEDRGDARVRRAVLDRLERILVHDQYVRVDLLDSGGIERLSAPKARSGASSRVVRDVSEAYGAHTSIIRDFYREGRDGKVYLSSLTPLYDDQAGGRPVGAVQVVVDPDMFLYPFINEWPTSSRTAETLLIRREGAAVLFLNELRFRRHTALSLRFPLENNAAQTAVQAVLGRKTGIIEGVDYRGVPVVADVRPVPGSPWFLVSRMDLSEVYAPVRERLWVMVVLVTGLLIGAAAGIGTIWRRQILRYFQEKAEAAEALEQKNTELERFSYTISHDLKSPLVTIKTFLGYLEQDLPQADPERIGTDMQYIRTAADKMGRLLDELLEMSRIGKLVNPPERVPLRAVIDEALDMVAGGIAEKGIEVRVNNAPVTLFGDRPRLVEIWQNLLENAVKYMGDQPSPRIEIGIEPGGKDSVFFVRDNGMGIDPRFSDKVFGLFEKLDPGSEGTGLGLALVKRIVEMYRGTIRVESEGAGHGACFRFTLPGAFAD